MCPKLEQAIAYLQEQDANRVQEAIRLLQSTVFSFSMKLCGHREDAEDTMQDVLVSSLPHLVKIQDPRALSVWLYTVTKRRCWRNRRRSLSAPAATIRLDDLIPNERELDALVVAEANPEQLSIEKEGSRLVHRAVLRIPPQYRIVLILHDIEDLDTTHVAEALSLRPGTVRVRLHRARLLVRREMANQLTRRTKRVDRRTYQNKTALNKSSTACREVFANLSEYLDGRMEPRTCEQMRAHIEGCPQCVWFIRDLKKAIDRCHSLDLPVQETIGLALRRRLTDEYLRLLHSPS